MVLHGNMAALQLKRVFNYRGTLDSALVNIKSKLNPALAEGEPLLCSYMENGKEKYFLAIGGDNGSIKIFPSFDDLNDFISFIREYSGDDLDKSISNTSDLDVIKNDDGTYTLTLKESISSDIENLKLDVAKLGETVNNPNNGLSIVVNEISNELKAVETTVINHDNLLNEIKLSVDNIKVKDVDSSVVNGISLNLDSNGKIGVRVDVESLAVKANNVSITEDIGTFVAGTNVQDVLSGLNDKITESIGVKSIVEGSGISVDKTDENNPVLSIKIANGSSLKITEEGLDIT